MNRSGIIWIEKYSRNAVLDLSQETARGFFNTLRADRGFEHGDERARAALFLSGAKPEVETAQILYYSGHGSEMGPIFGQGFSTASFDSMKMGIGDLAFAVFDCCQMLSRSHLGRWQSAFHGLHYLLGFSSSVSQDETRGRRFAEYLNDGVPVPEAWRRAVTLTTIPGVTWACLRAVKKGTHVAAEESWSSHGVLNDPERPFAFLKRIEVTEQPMPRPQPVDRQHVTLFRAQARDLDQGRKRSLAARLGLDDGFEEATHSGWLELRRRSWAVELYPESGSFWLRRDRPFQEDGRVPPPADACEVLAEQYLRTKELDGNLDRTSVSVTMETLLDLETGEEVTRPVQRTVSRAFALEDLPVFGPGAKVHLGFAGEVVNELAYFWREPQPVDEVPVIGREEAEKRLRESEAFRHLRRESLELEEPCLGYFARPPRQTQELLIPVYEFRGVVRSPGLTYEFTRYVTARDGNGPGSDGLPPVFQ